MKFLKKITVVFGLLFLLTSCSNNKIINEFQELYNVETDLVKRMSYDDFLLFTEDITDDKLLKIFDVKELNYPIIVAYKVGELVGYYDSETETTNIKKYIDDLIHEAYPTVCTDAC